jgi:soluble lytic murein transglycosylase
MREPQFIPGEAPERGEDTDTSEYQSKGSRVHRGQVGGRGGRGYWVGPDDDDPVAGDGASRGARPVSHRSAGRGRARGGRRMLLWMGLSVVVLVALVIVGVLVLTGETAVPVLSAKLFPMHYQEDISRVAQKYDQDPYLIAAMVKTESGYDATAESPAGATGLMQLMPATAEWVAARIGEWKGGSGPVLTDPAYNLELGAWYLDYLGDIYGAGSLAAVAAYNGGLGHVDEWIADAGGPDSFDASDILFPETRQYVERVERYRLLYMRVYPDAFAQTAR